MYKVFAKTKDGIVTAINSDVFLPETDGWAQIDEGEGDRFYHAQGNYLPLSVMTIEGVYRYKLVDGEVIERTGDEIQADIDAIPPPPPDPLVVTQKAATVMFRALAQTDVITPVDALENAVMFPLWAERVSTDVNVGEYLRYDNGLYRVKQAHKIQVQYPPSTETASLYSRVTMPGEILDWAPGSWDIDVKVRHNNKIWISKVPNNTWEPGAVGVYENIWKEITV